MNQTKTKQPITMETSSKHNCQYCGKEYTRKSSHARHIILCEIFHETKYQTQQQIKREIKCEEEEASSIPSTKQLYKIIQELAIKYQKMEEKMAEMQKWVDKKKQKINIIKWLNMTYAPNINIQSWIQSIQVTEEHIEILIEQNMIKTISAIINKKLEIANQDKSYVHPLFCVLQKTNLFYCYNSAEEKWIQFSIEEFIIMLKKVHSKILTALCEWHDKNIDKINHSDKMQILYNKTMIKLMSSNFTQDSQILSKIRGELYQYLKKDLETIIGYDYEF